MIEAGCTLMVISVLAVIAAIVGGNFSVPGARFGPLSSKPLRWLLAIFGGFAGLVGLVLLLMGLAVPAAPPAPPDPTPPPTHSSPSADEPPTDEPSTDADSWPAYAAKANKVCKDLDGKQRKQTWPDEDAAWSAHAEARRRNVALQDEALAKLRILPAPPEQFDALVGVWDLLQLVIETEEQLIVTLDAEDPWAYEAALSSLQDAQATFSRSARGMGLVECVYR